MQPIELVEGILRQNLTLISRVPHKCTQVSVSRTHSDCIGCVRKFTLKCHMELRVSLFLWRVDKSRRVAMRIGDVLHFSVIPLVLKDDRARTCLPRNLHASARSCGYGMDSPRRRRICRKPAWLLFRLQENRPVGCGPLVCGLRRKKQLSRKWGTGF